ncbi:MAG: type II toxin-antitoxin system VapC family toxin [bacterium]|nr:type II toxin-antitoxin system VapC family toxin [bacterium]
MILTDTCVLIEYFKEKPGVTEIIKNTGPGNIVLNSVIVMELLAGARNKVELNSIKKRLNEFQVLEINQSVMDDAGFLMENYYLSHELKIPDAIIAATSRYHGVSLFTFNKKDFRYIPGIKFFS